MVLIAALVFAPICVVGRVFTPPGTMNKVIVNVANSARRLVRYPPNPDGGFMMFLDPGVYTFRLVQAKGKGASGPLGSFTVTEGQVTRICVAATAIKPGFGRLEGTVSVPGMGAIPSSKLFKNCNVTVSLPSGKPVKTLPASVYGIFSTDLAPGSYVLSSSLKSSGTVKATITAGTISSVTIP